MPLFYRRGEENVLYWGKRQRQGRNETRGRGEIMDIQGLQKLTLLDWPGRVACTVFLGGCNFRCPFCHNGDLVIGPFPDSICEGEFLAYLEKRRGLLDGVCVTGGEPLLRPDLENFLTKIKELGFPVKLDTNGSDPAALQALWERGLIDYAAMDLKNSPARYAETVGLPGLDLGPIRESAAWLLEGYVDYEFRTTVVREFHNAEDFLAMADWIAGAKRYFLQSFVDRETVLRPGLTAWGKEDLERFADLVRHKVPSVQLRGVE